MQMQSTFSGFGLPDLIMPHPDKHHCENCGELRETIEIDGEQYCPDCCYTCDNCGESFTGDCENSHSSLRIVLR